MSGQESSKKAANNTEVAFFAIFIAFYAQSRETSGAGKSKMDANVLRDVSPR